jgi:hypothetical protein
LSFFSRATSSGGTLSMKSTSPASKAEIRAGPDLIGLKVTLSNSALAPK